MPLEDVGSYGPTMSEFGIHWGRVNLALGGTPATDLKLAAGFTLADFLTLRDAILAKITSIEGFENGRQIAADVRDSSKTSLRDRLAQLRAMIRVHLAKSKYASSVPVLPDVTTGESKFMVPFDDAADLWSRIDADTTIAGFTPPLVIAGYTRANFVTDIAAMRAAFLAVLVAENDKRMAIRERDVLFDTAREYMVQYRSGVEGLLGPNHPLTQTLPIITAPAGSTPSGETLSGQWNPTTGEADFSWTASSNPNLDSYQLRASTGDTYDAASVSVVANLPTGTLTHSTSFALANPGDVASFKVFVVLTTGNEAGSNTVTIARP